MANYKLMIPFLLKWEGGLSKSKTDKASRNPVPDGSGYHTNKGITWTTFVSNANRFGYKANDIQLFYKMPDDLWGKFLKYGYWDVVGADKINSQPIAEAIVDWAWMSGPGTAIKQTRKFLGLPASTRSDDQFIKKLNSIQDVKSWLTQFNKFRKAWLVSLSGDANDKGWFNRLDYMYKNAVAALGTGLASGIGIFLLLVIIGGAILVSLH